MKPIIIDMKDISDSTEVYDSRPHPFFVLFIYLIVALILIALGWMYFFKIDIDVKSNGIFKTNETTVYVSSKTSGSIIQSNLEEGKFVSAGDTLLEIDHTDIDRNRDAYQVQLNYVNDRISILQAYLKSLEGDDSDMQSLKDNQFYTEFTNRKQLVSNTISAADMTSAGQINQYQQNVSSINDSIEYYEKQKNDYNTVLGCIKSRNNTFSQEDTYNYSLVDSYIASYVSAQKQYDDKLSQYNDALALAQGNEKSAYQQQIDSTEKEKDNALNSLETEEVSTIQQKIQAADSSLLTLKGNLNTASAQLKAAESGITNVTNSTTVLTEKNNVNTELLTYKAKQDEYNNDLNQLDVALQNCEIKADIDGYISMGTTLENGNYIQQGTQICQIIPPDTGAYYVEMYVENQNIGKIKEGQEVKFEVASYPSSEYGYFTGKVETISKDVKVSNSGSAYYLVKVSCDNSSLYNKKGQEVSIMNGMACQAKVVTDKQSVLEFVMKKINLID